MGEPYRTWDEIKKLYPKEWVMLDKVTTRHRRSDTVTGGVVVLHSADHPEFLRRMLDFPEVNNGAILYTTPPTIYDPDPDEV